jgi:uncharacterized protein
MKSELLSIEILKGKRKKKIKLGRIIELIIIFLVIAFNAIMIFIGNILYYKAINVDTNKNVNQYKLMTPYFNEVNFNSYKKDDVTITSKYGYKLNGTFIHNPTPSKNTVVLLHDLGASRWSSLKFLDMYINKGFNVLIYDARDHGTSGGTDVSYGYYEKYDLDKWISYIQSRNIGGIIGVHGEGLGAAVALQHMQVNRTFRKVKFYIADSSYSNLKDEFSIRLSEEMHIKIPFLNNLILFYEEKVMNYKSHFNFTDLSPINNMEVVNTPVLFIHGENDNYPPAKMSKDMFDKKSGFKNILIVPNASHGQTFTSDEKDYTNAVYKFIDNAINDKNNKGVL